MAPPNQVQQVNNQNLRRPPALNDLRKYAVNRAGAVESIYEPLYDYQPALAVGSNIMTFFQTPVGQGGATLEDTNMRLAGSLPSPQQFLITNIQVDFRPGVAVSNTSTVVIGATDCYANDVEDFLQRGVVRLRVGSKDYLVNFPTMKFPPAHRLTGFAAVAGATAALDQIQISYAQSSAGLFQVAPILLQSTQNFSVTLEWPEGANALPSGLEGRVGVILGGYLYRNSQ